MSPSAKQTEDAGIPGTIAREIHALITRGALSPGVHLGQVQLAERFAVSRVPVREALERLAAEGIVVHDPNRGFFVATLSSDEARQLYRMRQLLEAELLSTIEWPTPAQLQELEARLARIGSLPAPDRAVAQREFVSSVFELSKQKLLVREVLRLWLQTDRYLSLLPGAGGTGATHPTVGCDVLEALARRDRARLLEVFALDRAAAEKLLLDVLHARGL